MNVELFARTPGARQTFSDKWQTDFQQVPARTERMQADTVCDLAGNAQHRFTHGGDRDRHHRQSRRLRRECRCH
jgi:hypothetical protein